MSNTRVKVLKIRLEQLQTERDVLETRQHRLRMRKSNEQKLMLGSYFHVSDDKFVCVPSSDSTVRLKYAGDSYGDIVSYQLDYNWNRDEKGERAKTSKIYHNGSTYNDVDQSILDQSQARFEFMQCAVDHNDDIIAAWNTIEMKYDKLIDSFTENSRELRDSLSSQSRDITELEKEALTEKLTGKGVEFITSKDEGYFKGSLPQLEVRYDWTIGRIKALKVLRMTASGKSADLQITQKSNRWDEDTKSYMDTDITDTYNTVRMDKVEQLIRSAKRNSQLVG
jgi:hypothetical protein